MREPLDHQHQSPASSAPVSRRPLLRRRKRFVIGSLLLVLLNRPMQRSALLVLVGGLLAAVAFFLPFLANGLFGSGLSLLQALPHAFQHFYMSSPIDLALVFEPLGALLMIAGAGLALKNGRAAFVLGLSGAVLGLTLLVWYFSFLYEVYPYAFPEESFGGFIKDFGSGYWLAVVGCVLGVVGALLGALEQPVPVGGRTSGIQPGSVLVLCGGLAVVLGFFMPLFATAHQSAFDFIELPDGSLIFWPEPLAALLLLASGLLGTARQKAAYLGGLSGALVALSFLLLVFPLWAFPDGSIYVGRLGIGYWLTAVGSVLGLAGAVRGWLGRSRHGYS